MTDKQGLVPTKQRHQKKKKKEKLQNACQYRASWALKTAFVIASKLHFTCKYSVLFFPSRVVVMAGDFICLQKQFRSCFKPQNSPFPAEQFLQKKTHRDAFSVRYFRTSCSLAEEGNWRFWGTWLHAAQFFWKQGTAGHSRAAGCTEKRPKKQLDKPFVRLQTCRCRVHPRH